MCVVFVLRDDDDLCLNLKKKKKRIEIGKDDEVFVPRSLRFRLNSMQLNQKYKCTDLERFFAIA